MWQGRAGPGPRTGKEGRGGEGRQKDADRKDLCFRETEIALAPHTALPAQQTSGQQLETNSESSDLGKLS